MVINHSLFPGFGKKVVAFFCLLQSLFKCLGGAEFTIMLRFRIHYIDTDKVTGDSLKTGIDDTFLPDPFFHPALPHQLINIFYGDHNKTPVVFHAGDPHQHVKRFPFFDPAVNQLMHPAPIQRLLKKPAVHGLQECRLVIFVHKYLHFLLAFLKKIRAAPCLIQHPALIVGVEFDVFVGVHINIVQVRVTTG